MREAPNYISGFESVVAAFGYWPSFHDSPVLKFSRTTEFVELQVEAWEMTSEVDSRGYFVLIKRHEIGFRFAGISSAELDDFTPDNILFELGFSPIAHFQSTGQFHVNLDSAMGGDLCGRFAATSGAVTFIRSLPIEESAETISTIEEVRAWKEENAAEHAFDLGRIIASAREREASSKEEVINAPQHNGEPSPPPDT